MWFGLYYFVRVRVVFVSKLLTSETEKQRHAVRENRDRNVPVWEYLQEKE